MWSLSHFASVFGEARDKFETQQSVRKTALAPFLYVLMSVGFANSSLAVAQTMQTLQELSIDDLSNLQITSVSKSPEAVNKAPAAIYVISHEDITRSGATSLPEILRLTPNLQVAQLSPSDYVITARGFSGNFAAQNFSDKLLVLVDGRSVYNPLFSGMYWDMQGVPIENIERIEVISGPGATLWGANAVNGVINIVTRKSSETPGGVLELGIGNIHSSASLQYGGRLSDDATFRIYGQGFHDNAFDTTAGTPAHDGWTKEQGGFRFDWTPANDQLTLQGDIYHGREDQAGGPDQLISGGNIQGSWQHQFADGSSLQVLTYYDRVEPTPEDANGGFNLNTYDIEVQHNFTLGDWNTIVWGVGERITDYKIRAQITPATALLFSPGHGQLNLADIFAQDKLTLSDDFDLTIGLKLEDDPYSGITPMPSVKAAWQISDKTMLWAAISRAIRSPTPFDVTVVEKLGPTVFLTGNPDFLPEKLTAYEVGYRGELFSQIILSITAFDHSYDDLKSIEVSPSSGFLPLLWGNMMEGNVYGVEAWGSYQAADWWRLSAGLTLQNRSLRFKPGSSGLLGVAQAGDDPHHQASLKSSLNLSDRVSFDADLRYVGKLPNPEVPAYVEMTTRLSWAVNDKLDLSISGFNLLHAHHREFTLADSDNIPRSFFIDTRWKF